MGVTIIGRECRHVTHIPAIKKGRYKRDDMHYIKEYIHYSDGTKKSNVRHLINFKRPYWITKDIYKDHNDKKENEELKKVNKFYSTESDLANNVARSLGRVGYNNNYIRDVADNPYFYGTDITSSALIKQMYLDKFPDFRTKHSYCALDMEWDVVTNVISMATIGMKDKLFSIVVKDVFKGTIDTVNRMKEMYDKHIPEFSIIDGKEVPTLKNKIKPEIKLVDTPIEGLKLLFKKLHEWKPDTVGIWGLDADIPMIIKTCERAGVDPKELFSDPSLPPKYKYFKYLKGRTSHLKESGDETPIPFHHQWHSVICSASFVFVDAMSTYNFVRVGSPEVPGGYGLDNILDINLKLKKLKIGNYGEGLAKGEWHKYMVKHRPFEYFTYSQWDVMSMIELEEKTNDLTITLPTLAGPSEYRHFSSGPKKILDLMHFYLLQEGFVIGTAPKTMNTDKILGLKNWIVTLHAYRIDNVGLDIIKNSLATTTVRGHVFDVDVTSAYPSATVVMNLSKETTKKELVSVEGFEKEYFKHRNMNAVYGKVNAYEYCVDMLNAPKFKDFKRLLELTE